MKARALKKIQYTFEVLRAPPRPPRTKKPFFARLRVTSWIKKAVLRSALTLLLTLIAITTTAQNALAAEEHIVQPGETLSRIAARYGTTAAALQRLNKLPNANLVRAGQRLLIEAAAPSANAAPAVQNYRAYTVRPGDSLTHLADTHGITLSRLMSINGLTSPRWLYVGQILRLPALPGAPAPPRSLVHTVRAGDTVSAIAAQHRVTTAAVLRLNGLTEYSLLTIGQTLRLPSPDALELLEDLYPRLDPAHYPTTTERWIEVDLSEQLAIAYEGAVPVKVFIISSGAGNTPTVTGTFRIWAKIALQDMRGGNRAAGTHYHLKDVPNVQYFYQDYGFHGAYWHNNFGAPMSRGCINMTEKDAAWLFDWTSPWTPPRLHADDWLFSTRANPGTLIMVHQ